MIGKLRGYIDSLQDDKCIIDVNGVGYQVSISSRTSHFLSKYNDNSDEEKNQVSLIIETIVKEDSIELFGFASQIERSWFLEVTKVQGVGAKVGLKILAYFSIEDLACALSTQDHKMFCNISGIGPKLAQRIVGELKGSPKKLGVCVANEYSSQDVVNDNKNIPNISDDALSALENLGYKRNEVMKVVGGILKANSEIKLESLITKSLQSLVKKSA